MSHRQPEAHGDRRPFRGTLTCRGCLLGALALLALAAAGLALCVWGAGRFLAVEEAPQAADAIVVLGGDVRRAHRARHAVALFEQGYAPRVVFSGGTVLNMGLACSSAQLSREAAEALGLPADAAELAPEAQSTYAEAANLARLARERGWGSLLVVTDPLHTRRAARTFRHLAPGVQITVSAAPDPRTDPARWWATEEGLVAVGTEALKLGFYWIRYGIPPVGGP